MRSAGRARPSSAIRRARSRWPRAPTDAVAQGLPRRHLRRRGLVRGERTPDLQHRSGDHRLDARMPRPASGSTPSSSDRREPNGCDASASAAASRAAAVLPLTDPAITRKRTIEGDALEVRRADCAVTSIEPLGMELPLYDITTGTGDFIANGVVSHNCFARPTHEYLDINAGRDFEREIVVKVNVPEVLRAELARPSWKRRARRAGHEHRPVPVGRGPLQADARDLGGDARLREPVLDPDQVAAACCATWTCCRRSPSGREVSACLSVPTLDEKAWRATEPHTPNPRARLEAVAELNRRGHPDRDPDRAADARASTTRRSRSSGSSSWRPRPARRAHRRDRRCSCAARCGRSSSTGCASTGRTWCRATSGCTRAARTCRPTSGGRSSVRPARRGRAGRTRSGSAPGRTRAAAAGAGRRA